MFLLLSYSFSFLSPKAGLKKNLIQFIFILKKVFACILLILCFRGNFIRWTVYFYLLSQSHVIKDSIYFVTSNLMVINWIQTIDKFNT